MGSCASGNKASSIGGGGFGSGGGGGGGGQFKAVAAAGLGRTTPGLDISGFLSVILYSLWLTTECQSKQVSSHKARTHNESISLNHWSF